MSGDVGGALARDEMVGSASSAVVPVLGWPSGDDLDAEQDRLRAVRAPRWRPGDTPLLSAGVFLAFARGQAGPGHPGDLGWAGAAIVREPGHELVAAVTVQARAGARYDPGRLALREGPALAQAVCALSRRPDVVLVDATGRDHPRRAGLALHLGAVLDLPTVGVTHRTLRAEGAWPADEQGAWAPLTLDGDVVGAWVRTQRGVRPVAVHAAWRTDPDVAIEVVLRCTDRARAPEPLRQARTAARTARAAADAIEAAGPNREGPAGHASS